MMDIIATNTETAVEVQPQKDIIVSSFHLHKNGILPIGNPTFEQWEKCVEFVRKSEQAVHFWIGDLINYGENRWGEMYSQALNATDFSLGTLQNDKYVASRIPITLRRPELSFEHHKAVAKLEPEQQNKWLEKAADEKMTVKELRESLRPPKKHDDQLTEARVALEQAAQHYCLMAGISRDDMAIVVTDNDGNKILKETKFEKLNKENFYAMFGE